MLTRNHRQEALSRAYVQAVAAQAGVICSKPDLDYGIDLSLRAVALRDGHHADTSIQIDLQLRSTTRAHVTDSAVAYDLDVDTYNDLRLSGLPCPRILVVLVLPVEETEWISQSSEELRLRRCAYWLSLEGLPAVTASRTIRIALPLTHVFSPEAVQSLLQRASDRRTP